MAKLSADGDRGGRGVPRHVRWGLAVVALLVQIPFLSRGISLLDEGSILAIADGLSHGESLYVDRATPLAPLTYELVAVLFEIFGPSLMVARVLAALVFAGCVVVLHAMLCRVVSPRAALLGAVAMLGLKPLAFPFWTIVNYSQLAMLFCLASLWILLRFLDDRRPSWLLAAGIGIGLTLATKQNLGVLLGATVFATCALDWLRDPERRDPTLSARLATVAAGTALTLAAVLAPFAVRGSLGALIERAVTGLRRLPEPYWIPLPGLELWALTRTDLGILLFTYFPPPLSHLALEGRLDMTWRPLMLTIELAAKAFYYVPLLLLACTVLLALRHASTDAERTLESKWMAVGMFAGLTYASMLYRADWIHLMNIYPALVAASVVILAPPGVRRTWARIPGIAIVVVWFGSALALTAVILTTYRATVDTPRGRLLAAPGEAADAAAVLDFAARRPATDRIAFLRTEPLYYFLSGRRIPLAFDFLMPGILQGADDQNTAERLGAVDFVVYNPKPVPTVPTPITTYAPATARALARDFRVDGVLGESAVVLRRREESTVPPRTP